MNVPNDKTNHLLELSKHKLTLLQELLASYQLLYQIYCEDIPENAVAVLKEQKQIIEQIDEIDRQFTPLFSSLVTKIADDPAGGRKTFEPIFATQKRTLEKIKCENRKCIAKGEKIKRSAAEHIQTLNRQKNILDSYYGDNERKGFFLDYKEGK